MSKKFIISAIQAIFLICPVLWLIFAVDYKSVAPVLKSVNWVMILFLLAIIIFRQILQSIRFYLLITPFCDKIKMGEYIILDWKARYYSIILPTTTGLDISRAVLLSKRLSAGEIIAVSVFFRITGIIALVLLSVIGLFRLYSQENILTTAIIVGIFFFTLCALMAISLNEKANDKILSLLPKKTPKKIADFLKNASETILLYKKHPKLVVFTMFFAFILHILYIIYAIFAVYSVCGELKIIECLTFVPLIEIIAASVPFSPSGAGIREGLSILFFDFMGFSKEQAFSYITVSTVLYLSLVSGIFIILFEKIKKAF
ncbi:MAG: flippase-like domain-containing protein [Chitinivibrionia bacterium]|nr:flippase-like domain-containing protein [Chitinivibrionia bacterium]